MSATTPVEILEAGIERLKTYGRCTGQYYARSMMCGVERINGPSCIIGCLRRTDKAGRQIRTVETEHAKVFASMALEKLYNRTNLISWHDSEGVTDNQVIEVLQEAISIAKASSGIDYD